MIKAAVICILASVTFLLSIFTVFPQFWEMTYAGDGEYDANVYEAIIQTYEVMFPEFSFSEESTQTYKLKRFQTTNNSVVQIVVTSETPLHLALLSTSVSIQVKDRSGQIVYKVDAPLNSHYDLCGMEEPEFRDWQQNGMPVWYSSHCKDEPEEKTSLSFFVVGLYGETEWSWWEDYELSLEVKNPDKANAGLTAHLEILGGGI